MEPYDIAIIGGGHAGCEAALAASRLGLSTILFAIQLDSIAMMPCNPNIGGSSKGHLVREIDALGGEMGKNIDKSFIQSRMLNTAKGPAVHALRAQADKIEYFRNMKSVLENQQNLRCKQAEVVDILCENGKVTGVVLESGAVCYAKAIVLAMGTYLNARCLTGDMVQETGPNGYRAATLLSHALQKMGISLMRFKTGTPARIDKNSLDFSKMQEQPGDKQLTPFSFENSPEGLARPQVSCYLTYTTEETHRIIRENLHRSPMFSGAIEGTGTRYCPSIEDKVVRFADKERHQVFVEPEGANTTEMYVAGMSTSLPEDVQIQIYRTLPGMEQCEIMRNGYAIEYDCLDATLLKSSLEFKKIAGLFSAGQFNGTSGYEEAAAQGLVAGINAALHVRGKEPLLLDRSDGYIGVMIDDIVLKGSQEPYRMMTSRAEYRLLLRQDNADLRLTEKGYRAGLIPEERYQRFLQKKQQIEDEINRVSQLVLPPTQKLNEFLEANNSASVTTGVRADELIRRPELSYQLLQEFDHSRPYMSTEIQKQVDIQIKYAGYIQRQLAQVEQFKKSENKKIPHNINYLNLSGLRLEARQKLDSIRPANIGQASRITGVTPADLSVLLVHLKNTQ